MKAKDQSIETLRGLAIILVVAGYIIKGDLVHGVHSHFSSALDFTYYLLKPIRMPLFTVISAYLYASSPATQTTLKELIRGKFRRLMLPFFSVSTIQYAFYALVPVKGPHPLAEIYKIYLYPLEQFWFIWSVFWIFILVGFMDSKKMLETPGQWLKALCVALMFHIFIVPTEFFSLWGVNYLLPFFLLGYGLRRFSKDILSPKMIKAYLTTAILTYPVYTYFYLRWVDHGHYLYLALSLIISMSAVPLVFHFRRQVPILAKIGYYAFGIHIFNKIASAMPRLVFQHFHIVSPLFIFAVYLSCGILLSIGLQMIVERFVLTRKFILGIKDFPKPISPDPTAAPAVPIAVAVPVELSKS